MASKTKNYGLNKHSPQDFYSVEARNENWDKIDEALAAADPTKITAKAAPADGDGVLLADSADGGKAKRLLWSNVKAALGKLFVPLSRKVNGKTLAKDVTLTAADIKMPDSEEDVGAAMAKRNVDYGLISPENLQKWALKQSVSGTFLLTPSTTGGVPKTRYWFGQLICITKDVYNDYALNIWTDQEYYSCVTSGGKWSNPWIELAQSTAPEVHELPLSNGWQTYGEGLCWYACNQFEEVTIGMLVRGTSALTSDGTQFATMPEGFRPRVAVVAPANATANDYSHSACHVTINPDGGVYLHFDASSLSGKTVVQLVCPVFHYPAG